MSSRFLHRLRRRFFEWSESGLHDELNAHLEEKTDELIAGGLDRRDARLQALREFGNVTLTAERAHDVWRSRLLDEFMQDSRYAWRMLRNSPAFALTAVLTLALGIGANSAMFTVVNAVLLKPLDYQDPDRLVRLAGGSTITRYEALQQAHSFSGVGAFSVVQENAVLTEADGPFAVKSARVTANFLSVLGVSPAAGRSFANDEEQPGHTVAMISSSLWQTRFGGAAGVVGRTVRIDGDPCTIVGVLPPHFQFPANDIDLWRPWQPDLIPLQTRLHSVLLNVFGRLQPGITLAQASAELALINERYVQSHPEMLDAKRNRPEPAVLFKDQMVRDIRSILWMLTGAVGFVLVIVCANVASLLLARSTARSREFAIRAAIGASRGHLVRQLLTESLLLAVLGGLSGVALAEFGVRAIEAMPGLNLPRLQGVHVDLTVLCFAFVLSVVTTLLFGLLPAWTASRPDLVAAIKSSTGARLPKRLTLWRSPRGLLVSAQVALSIVLLIGAALLIETVVRVRSINPGFQPANLLTMQLALAPARYPTTVQTSQFYEELVRRVEAIPGVRSAAVALTLPTTGWAGTPVHLMGEPLRKLNERPLAILQNITPDYFRTLGIALKRGRELTSHDSENAPLVVVINESLARHFWPAYPKGEDPIGHFLLAGANVKPLQIVGIVSDVRQSGLSDDIMPGIYRPRRQVQPMPAMFAVRTQGDPLQIVNLIRHEIAAIDPDQAVTAVRTMDDAIDESEGQRQSIAKLLGLFAFVGLTIAIVGIYGVVAYSVEQRTREMGIRRALGAQRADILRLVLGQGLVLVLVGAAIGIGGALAVTRVLKALLFGVGATDPRTFAAVTLLQIAVALLATYIPARWATKVDPAKALRAL